MTKKTTIASWIAQGIAVSILAMAAVPKFLGAAESVAMFQTLGVEPWGRYLTGVGELVAIGLLLSGRWSAYGAVVSAGLMVGAIGAHLTRLGIVINDDGGTVFIMALVVFAASLTTIYLRREQLPIGSGATANSVPAS